MPSERAYRFGRHDRLVIDGQSYRVVRKERDTHFLQLVIEDLVEDHYVPKTDKQVHALMRSGRLRIDEGYFSKALSQLRFRHDNSDLRDLSEAELRKIAWRKEWCVRFLRAAGDPQRAWRPKWTLPDMRAFVESEKDEVDRWYLDRFGERRPPGRRRKGEIRKAFDYPGASTLREWLLLYRDSGYRMEAFKSGYKRCGNRYQIDPRALPVVNSVVQGYCSVLRPRMSDICEDIELELANINRNLPEDRHIRVSDKAIRRRIHAIDPFIRDFGRHGEDWALRKYTPVGKGLEVTQPLQRVEIDDWEIDLHTLIVKSSTWKNLTPEAKAKVPRCRGTLTVAIDCATRAIVGFHATFYSPSAATAKSALRTVMIDKSPLAQWAGAESNWPMYGRIEFLATDGGPVFRGEFEECLRMCRSHRTLPDQDPRMRGTIEAFFRTFKRLCRYFAGRSFSNVLEKGDYPSEQMASLTFEEFVRAAVVFIVDNYHHRKHRGLEGGTPYGAWETLSAKGLPPPLSRQQLKATFGFKDLRNVDKHGISFLKLSYHSKELGALHRLVGREQVQITVDPDDLTSLLVRIPDKHLGRIAPEEQQYLEVPCLNNIGDDVTLVDLLEEIDEVKAFVKEQQEAGKPFRLSSHGRLLDDAKRALKTSNLPSHEITQKYYDLVMNIIAQKERAALSNVQYATMPPETSGDGPGEVVARSKRTKSRTSKTPNNDEPINSVDSDGTGFGPKPEIPNLPFGGGMNLYGEEDEH